jgi:hypothetical protein
MRRDSGATVLGVLLILGGLFFLLMNFGILPELGALMIALLFAAGGAAFLLVFLTNSERWWALFPGFTLLGIASIIALSTLFPQFNGPWLGALFLGGLSVAFWIVYLTHPENWWAVIPGGVLMTLAFVAGLADTMGAASGGIFFIGLGLTFGLVYVLPTPSGRMTWAIWPAGACLLMGILLSFMLTGLLNIAFPLALIVAGVFVLVRYLHRREA